MKELEEKKNEKESETIEEKEPELNLEKRSFVLCVDNIGKDEELSQKDIDFIVDKVEHFKASWQKKES